MGLPARGDSRYTSGSTRELPPGLRSALGGRVSRPGRRQQDRHGHDHRTRPAIPGARGPILGSPVVGADRRATPSRQSEPRQPPLPTTPPPPPPGPPRAGAGGGRPPGGGGGAGRPAPGAGGALSREGVGVIHSAWK